jgi:SHS2 domain-containing protein
MKYPEFNKNELSKTKSTIKEDAPAEILYSSISNLIINGQLETKVFKRIKIYNKEKSSQYLDVEIPLYEGNGEREYVSGLKAVTYNLENDKVVSSKVEKDAKFKSKEQKNQVIQKFTFPNVKDGSIIEYQYQVNTPFLQLLDKTYLEFDIPIIYEEYVFDFPKFFGYNYNFQGGLMPKYKEDQAQMMYGQVFSFTTLLIAFFLFRV